MTTEQDRDEAYDNGGDLPPSIGEVTNDTGRPEPVLTAEQFREARADG